MLGTSSVVLKIELKSKMADFVAMVTKDLQTLNLKFDQVMFNSLVLTWERNFEVTFSIFSVSVFQINVLEISIYFKISYDQKCKIVII